EVDRMEVPSDGLPVRKLNGRCQSAGSASSAEPWGSAVIVHPNRAQKWLVITGAFVLILAAVFAVLATVIPVVRVGFIPAAAVLSLTGIFLLVLGRRARAKATAVRRVLESGTAGTGTIVTMSQTGRRVKPDPQARMH